MNREKYYCAYGSNLNHKGMAKLCPNSKIFAKGILENYRLVFKGRANSQGYLSIVETNNYQVPVLLWEIDPNDMTALDKYEDYPNLYDIVSINVLVGEEEIEAFAYKMNIGVARNPKSEYVKICLQGYLDNNFMTTELSNLVNTTKEEIKSKKQT